MDFADTKYKDELPLKTIGKVKDLLAGLGLLPVETAWRNSLKGFYSVTVNIAGTELATNGKGVSQEYALASAYGEMMERLQNFCTFRLSFDVSPEALVYKGFYYAPDEWLCSTDEYLAGGGEWLAAQLAALDPAVDLDMLLKLWQRVSYETVAADFVALPYCNLHTGNISRIPVKMVSKMYMSNGMCAGNTPEEALVQGIAELFERHVNQRIVRERITPPDVPRAYLERFPGIAAMVDAIEASGNRRVTVKDCSLGRGYPVVGVIYANLDDASYFVKFGSHPSFEIAAERTLTELLQGQDIRRMMGVREFAFQAAADSPENMMGILVNGSGVYPREFFALQPSYGFEPWQDAPGDNRGMLAYLLGILKENNRQAYVRDVSFLGFPAFHVLVPGFSEVEAFDDVAAIREYADYNSVRKLLRGIESLNAEERGVVIAFLERLPYSPEASVLEFLNLPVRDPGAFPWYYSSLDLLLVAMFCSTGRIREAAGLFERIAGFAARMSRNGGVVIFYRCVRDYLAAREAGLDDGEIQTMLGRFYPAGVMSGVVRDFSDLQQVAAYLGNLSCFECERCSFREHCLHQPAERVYRLLKERYAACVIDQRRLGYMA